MPNYCVNMNEQANGDHEVHDLASPFGCLPSPGNRLDLGAHSSCFGAVSAAKQRGYTKANGCVHCARVCHTS